MICCQNCALEKQKKKKSLTLSSERKVQPSTHNEHCTGLDSAFACQWLGETESKNMTKNKSLMGWALDVDILKSTPLKENPCCKSGPLFYFEICIYPEVGNIFLNASNLGDGASNNSLTALYLLCIASLYEARKNSSNWSAPVSKPVRRGHASRLLLCCVQVGEVAPRGQSVGRHHLVVYEPTESRVSTGFNGLLYSLPVRKQGKQRLSRVQGQTPHRIPTWTCRGGTW